MFARKVAARLKPDSLPQFTNLVNSEILPWLRKQEGFLDLIILADTDSREIATISFWDQKRNAELYSSNGYPEVLKVLEKLLDHGPPYVKTFEVVSSTFQRNALAQADSENLIQETARRSSSSYETSL
jgi:hypothetical protein